MIHHLPALPFAVDSLAPWISQETVEYHYGKHHRGYVKKLNELLVESELKDLPLEQLIIRATGPLFNNAAQVWNHTFFWNCLSPAKTQPSDRLRKLIEKDFGSFDALSSQFKEVAVEQFASGWAWLVYENNKLCITTTHDADNPLRHGHQPLLTCDLWEHAYYIDYRNDRAKFLDGFLKLANWNFASANLETPIEIAA